MLQALETVKKREDKVRTQVNFWVMEGDWVTIRLEQLNEERMWVREQSGDMNESVKRCYR